MSNCNRHRHLIQQKFDIDLSPQDEREVVRHMEQCESCAKFHHQLQQVIMAAEEVQLPEEMQPPHPEALARTIMEQVPQGKPSPFAFLTKIFEMFSGKGKEGPAPPPRERTAFPHRSPRPEMVEQNDSVASPVSTASGKFAGRGHDARAHEDHSAAAAKLKTIGAKMSTDTAERESQGRTLGEKFGMAPPPSNADEQGGLTLAESIRRKISETKQPDELGLSGPLPVAPGPITDPRDDNWNKSAPLPASKMPPNMAEPPVLPGKPMAPPPVPQAKEGAPPVLGTWGKPSPSMEAPNSWGTPQGSGQGEPLGMKPAAPPPPPPIPTAPIPVPASSAARPTGGWSTSSGTWEEPPRGTQPGDEDSGWGPPPQGGTWEEPGWTKPAAVAGVPAAQPVVPPVPTPPAVPTASGASWLPGGSGAVNPASPPVDPGSKGWSQPSTTSWTGESNTAGWGQPAKAESWSLPENKGPGWGAKPNSGRSGENWSPGGDSGPAWSKPEGWGQPSSIDAPVSRVPEAQPKSTSESWSSSAAADLNKGGWGQPSVVSPEAGWGGSAPDAGAKAWGQQGGPTAWSTAPDASKTAQGGSAGWNQPGTPPAPGANWNAPGGAPAAPAAWNPQAPAAPNTSGSAVTNSGAWNLPGAGAPTPNQTGGPPTGGNAGWNAAPAAGSGPNQGSWNQAGSATGSATGWNTPGANSWNQPAAAAPNQTGWGQPGSGPPGDAKESWAPASGGTDSWGKGGAAGWGQPPQPRATQWTPPGTAPAPSMDQPGSAAQSNDAAMKGKQSWSSEAEQIETGTWKAFTPPADALGAKSPPPKMWTPSDAGKGQSFAPEETGRWDVPIQERNKMQQQQSNTGGQASPAVPPASGTGGGGLPPAVAPGSIPPGGGATKSAAGKDQDSPSKSGWNFPVYESSDNLKAGSQDGRIPDAQLWDLPTTDNPPASGLDKLGTAIGDAARSLSSGNAWAPKPMDWGQPPKPDAATPPPVTPAPIAPTPPPAPTTTSSGASWGAAPANTAAQANRWDIPIQERQAAAAASQAAAPSPPAGGLFSSIDDSAIDKIFSENLGVNDRTTSRVSGSPTPGAPPPGPSPAPPSMHPGAPPAMGMPAPGSLGAPNMVPGAPPSQAPQGSPGLGQPPAAGSAGPGQMPQTSVQMGFSGWPKPDNEASMRPGAPGAAPKVSPATPGGGNFQQPPMMPPQQPRSAPAQEGAPTPRITAIPPRTTGQQSVPQAEGTPLVDRRAPNAGAPIPPSPSAAAKAANADKSGGLFNLDDSAMDKLFAENLGLKDLDSPGRAAQPPAPMAPPQVMAAQDPAPPTQYSQPQMPLPPSPAASSITPVQPAAITPVQSGSAVPGSAPPGYSPAPPKAPAPIPPPSIPPPPSLAPEWNQAADQNQGQAQAQSGSGSGAGGLFSINDSVIDRIFSENLGIKEPAAPALNQSLPSSSEASNAPAPPPQIPGVGRLDPRTEVAQESGSGRIASIGKFLLDQKDLEKLGKITNADPADTKMRILTMEAAQELQTLLHHIGAQEKVVGSVIVGHDGLLIANTMPSDMDAESVGVWALGVYMNTEHVIKKMGQDRVHQIVSRTPRGYLVIADFGGGLLVTVSDGKDTDTLIPLMRSITQLVAQ